jgi:hypothetical protein
MLGSRGHPQTNLKPPTIPSLIISVLRGLAGGPMMLQAGLDKDVSECAEMVAG